MLRPTLQPLSWCRWKCIQRVSRQQYVTCLNADPNSELSEEYKKSLESFWKAKVSSHHETKKNVGDKFYVLSMFPYPSGRLHMGHVRVYSISDAMARYYRLQGKQVIHPMGWDAFGLPAENAAIERGERPDMWTHSNIEYMRKQLDDLCCTFDWDREVRTCSPEYYKWTQYIFLKLFEAGLAYQKEAAVNWDPVDQTVLADEQIDENGCSWRSGAVVEKRHLRQWYVRTRAYTKSLYDGLGEVNPELWKDIISLQRNWIGKYDGTHLSFPLLRNQAKIKKRVTVFTRNLEMLEGVSHILISEEHHLYSAEFLKLPKVGSSTESLLNVEALDLINNRRIPVFVTTAQNIMSEFMDTHLGIPAISTEDEEFAKKYKLKYTKDFTPGAFEDLAAKAKVVGIGGHISSEKARDWLISRQRYWGTPIPIIHCPQKGAVPVPYEDLPVKLPVIEKLTGKGKSPLLQEEEWLTARCRGCTCEQGGRRETDTMDTFVDSSWYFLRYLDSKNKELPFSPTSAAEGMPVDLYIGGKEHAIMHLYYARFFTHFLHGLGMVPHREPFHNLLTQGMVMGQSYRVASSGRYIPPDRVQWQDGKPFSDTSEPLITEWEKMSKSKYNGIDPQDIIDEHGCDAMRLLILSGVAPKSDRLWKQEEFSGVKRWQNRVWVLVNDFMTSRLNAKSDYSKLKLNENVNGSINDSRNFAVKEVSYHMNKTFYVSVAISRLQSMTSELKKIPAVTMGRSREFERALGDLIIMISPFAPMFASELWGRAASVSQHLSSHKWDSDVLDQTWPTVDSDYHLNMVVRLNEKRLFDVKMPYPHGKEDQLTKEDALEMAKSVPKFDQVVNGRNVDHISYVCEPGYKVSLSLTIKKKKQS